MTKKAERTLIYVGAVAILAITALIVTYLASGPNITVPDTIDEIQETDHTLGNPDAKIILIEYSDYECPACASYESLVQAVVSEFENHIQFAYRHYPLIKIHPNAQRAIRAAEAASLQGKFWEMHEKIFQSQSEWASKPSPEETFIRYAEELELDSGQFRFDYNSRELKNLADAAFTSATKLGLTYTPTFILNGEIIPNPQSHEQFRTLIRDAIIEAR